MFVNEIYKLQKVIDHGLCNRCGTCIGLSEGKIRFRDKAGRYLPEILFEPDENLARRIWNACSGKEFNFKYYQNRIFPTSNKFHTYLGSYNKIRVGYCVDPEIRKAGSSGGILSAILIWLLEKREISGAVVLRMSEREPWLTEPFIAKSRREILEAAQSKYIISSVNEILPEISSFEGDLAYVGLPGQVQSIRKLQEINDPSVRNIKYIFGPYYGNTMHFSSIKSLLRSYGEKDYHDIRNLQFRNGEWPGNLRIEMKTGKVIMLPKFHANYLIPFHILKNSLLCTDLSNEFTDISSGDAWAPFYEERGKGFSLIVSRTRQGQIILDKMAEEGVLCLNEISQEDAISMHSHGLDLKKRGTFIRIKFRKILGLDVPDYGYVISGFSPGRYIMEAFIDITFLVAGTGIVIWLIERISPDRLGIIFEKARKIWKKKTFKIKREGL
jgi:coenzyme F420 hydrogenase subunit beta